MKEFKIDNKDSGLRLDKQLLKILNNCSLGFIYKMLRKKNITLNDKRALGSEHLKAGDLIRIYFSDDTFEKLSNSNPDTISGVSSEYDIVPLIIFENGDFIILNKPAGLLSQKAGDKDVSINELCLKYMFDKNELTHEKLAMFRPSVCNRLDRNTSGLIIFAKNYSAAAAISKLLKTRGVDKYYRCIVKGCIDVPERIEGFLIKNERDNTVSVSDKYIDGASHIITEYRPLSSSDKFSLLEVKLVTGKSHQIRAHLSSIGHPILGDPKYGDINLNSVLKKRYGIYHQLLHSYELTVPDATEDCLSELAGRTFTAPLPDHFLRLLEDKRR